MAAKLTPKMHALEIIISIGDHWPHYIQRALLCTNVQIIQEALRFLNKLQIMVDKKTLLKIIVIQNDIPNTRTAAMPLLKTEHSHWFLIPVIRYVHTSLGHVGTEKGVAKIARKFQKIRKFISRSCTCQREMHPVRSCVVQNVFHLCTKPVECFNFDTYENLIAGQFGFDIYIYIFICFYVYLLIYTFQCIFEIC
jgi:hypothetical protein